MPIGSLTRIGDTAKKAAACVSVIGTLLGVVNFGVTKIIAYDNQGTRISKLEAFMAENNEYRSEARETKLRQEFADKTLDDAKRQIEILRSDVGGIRSDLDRLRYSLDKRP